MTEPMIPLSVIDTKINALVGIGFSMKSEFIMILEEIKKEAIPSSPPSLGENYDRIAELEQEKKEAEGKRGIFTNCLIEKIEELRKLLK